MELNKYHHLIVIFSGLLAALVVMLLAGTAASAANTDIDTQASADAGEITRSIRTLDDRNLSPSEVEAIVEELRHAGDVHGLALAVINDGEVRYLKGFGERIIAKGLPLQTDSIMYAASYTKSMFAYLVMQLVDQQLINLDLPIVQYLRKPLHEYPDFADLKSDARVDRITARMLLSHTAGFRNWRFFTADGRFDESAKLEFEFEPGQQYSYSGEGIQLLQLVVEEITGESVGELMQQTIFTPLGMSDTSMIWRENYRETMAYGYTETGESVGHNMQDNARAAGSADTTIADMATFLNTVMSGDGLSRASHQMMLAPQVRIRSEYQFPTPSLTSTSRDDDIQLSYGLGWGLLWTPHGKGFFKEGHTDGWENYMIGFSESGVGIVIMTNSANGESIFPELLERLVGDTYTPEEWERYQRYDASGAE